MTWQSLIRIRQTSRRDSRCSPSPGQGSIKLDGWNRPADNRDRRWIRSRWPFVFEFSKILLRGVGWARGILMQGRKHRHVRGKQHRTFVAENVFINSDLFRG